MAVVHVVLFQFKTSTSSADVHATCQRMLALPDKCRHPDTGKPYVKSHGGGRDNSPEGMQDGQTHGFVYEFESADLRDYYCFKDPAHLEFVETLKDILEKGSVVDFSPGVY